jgi:hypothetical protein
VVEESFLQGLGLIPDPQLLHKQIVRFKCGQTCAIFDLTIKNLDTVLLQLGVGLHLAHPMELHLAVCGWCSHFAGFSQKEAQLSPPSFVFPKLGLRGQKKIFPCQGGEKFAPILQLVIADLLPNTVIGPIVVQVQPEEKTFFLFGQSTAQRQS